MGVILQAVHGVNNRFAEFAWALLKEVTAGNEGLYKFLVALGTPRSGEPVWVPTTLGLVLYGLAIASSARLARHARDYRRALRGERPRGETSRWPARGAT